jgi:hypothetical protein
MRTGIDGALWASRVDLRWAAVNGAVARKDECRRDANLPVYAEGGIVTYIDYAGIRRDGPGIGRDGQAQMAEEFWDFCHDLAAGCLWLSKFEAMAIKRAGEK